MKKLIIIVAALASCLAVYSATISRVKIGLFNSGQARVINNSLSDAETAINAAAIVMDTNVTTTVTDYTPASVGQLLSGGAGTGTNSLWVAEGLTTNDWTQISTLAP